MQQWLHNSQKSYGTHGAQHQDALASPTPLPCLPSSGAGPIQGVALLSPSTNSEVHVALGCSEPCRGEVQFLPSPFAQRPMPCLALQRSPCRALLGKAADVEGSRRPDPALSSFPAFGFSQADCNKLGP